MPATTVASVPERAPRPAQSKGGLVFDAYKTRTMRMCGSSSASLGVGLGALAVALAFPPQPQRCVQAA